MSKKKDQSDERSKTDDLIDQAISSFETTSSVSGIKISPHSEEQSVRPVERNPEYDITDGKKVAKIDLKQYVEKEAFMRLAADFDNFRKRVLKERGEWERQGKEKVLRGFLDIIDNLRRGLTQPDSTIGPLAEGMRMVLSQAESWLQQEGLERVKTLGEMFDPNVHEAVARIEDLSKPDGMIVEELRCGYRWGDRLIRPASVVVVKSTDTGSIPMKE
jgi:molecular chaperone GrpE